MNEVLVLSAEFHSSVKPTYKNKPKDSVTQTDRISI